MWKKKKKTGCLVDLVMRLASLSASKNCWTGSRETTKHKQLFVALRYVASSSWGNCTAVQLNFTLPVSPLFKQTTVFDATCLKQQQHIWRMNIWNYSIGSVFLNHSLSFLAPALLCTMLTCLITMTMPTLIFQDDRKLFLLHWMLLCCFTLRCDPLGFAD